MRIRIYGFSNLFINLKYKSAKTLIFLIVLLSAIHTYADIYMYIDSEGLMHFTSEPTNSDYQSHIKEKPLPKIKQESLYLYNSLEDIKEVQRLLSVLGFYPGIVDGVIGKKTIKAIKAFQLYIGTEQTGKIDRKLISQLKKIVVKNNIDRRVKNRYSTKEEDSKGKSLRAVEILAKFPSKKSNITLEPYEFFKNVETSIYTVIGTTYNDYFKNEKELSQGSAVVISSNKLLTNFHVVKNKSIIFISQGKDIKIANIVMHNEVIDTCVLEIDKNSLIPIRNFRRFNELQVGEKIFAVGNPVGLEKTLTDGIISSLREENGIKYIQISAPISRGSSGGGLFDSRGNLIGITTFKIRNTENLNFAVAIDEYWN